MLTITLLILASALLLMFSAELIKGLKKLFSIPGVAWILPVLLVSYILTVDEDMTRWILKLIQLALQSTVLTIAESLPFKTGALQVAECVLLMSLSVVPVWLINVWQVKKNYVPLKHRGIAIALLWLFLVMVL